MSHILNLVDDVLLNIYLKLEINNLIYLSQCNKYFYYYINDNVYWLWAINKYSLKFWHLASLRIPKISKPLITIKAELIRIYLFQKHLQIKRRKQWDNSDFYTYWYLCEKNYNSN